MVKGNMVGFQAAVPSAACCGRPTGDLGAGEILPDVQAWRLASTAHSCFHMYCRAPLDLPVLLLCRQICTVELLSIS